MGQQNGRIMKTFKDSLDRTWTLALTVASVKRVRNLLGVDLLSLQDGTPPLITRLGTDVCLLCDVLFVLVKPDADRAEVTDEQFGQSLGGGAILDGQQALYAELIDFFHQLGRTELAVAVEKQGEIIRLATQSAATRMRKLDVKGQVDRAMAKADAEIDRSDPGSASTSSPAGSE